MANTRAIARALARQQGKAAPLTAEEIAAARQVLRKADDVGYSRNHVRGMMKFTADGMTPEAKAARAAEQGYGAGWYHGTPVGDIAAFRSSADGPLGPGVYASTAPERAEFFTDGAAPTMYPLSLRGPMASVDEQRARAQSAMLARSRTPEADSRQALRDEGYTGIAGYEGVDGRPTEAAVYAPGAVRSPFATFDPARANRRDLLAGITVGTAGLSAGAIAAQPQQAEAAPLNAGAIRAARQVFRAADDVGYSRNHARGMMKFGADGMTPEARMARAAEQGYTGPWYHGMTQPMEGDALWPTREGASGPGVYMGTATSAQYTPRGESTNLVPLLGRDLTTESPDYNWTDTPQGDPWPVRWNGEPAAIARDPATVRSPNATFDPARANRRDLLAGVAGAAGAGTVAAAAMQPQQAEAAPLNADAIRAARQVLRKADDVGFSRNHARGMMKFGADGMTPEARMARAREMGFDTETPLYRGLRQEFDPEMRSSFNGEFYATDPSVASIYAGRGMEAANVMPAFARRPTVFEDWGGAHYAKQPIRGQAVDRVQDKRDPGLINNLLDRVAPRYREDSTPIRDERPGYDNVDQFVARQTEAGAPVVQVDNTIDYGGLQRQVFVGDPTARRSPFATFDPARANRRDLLAGVAGAAGAGTVAAAAMQPQEASAAELAALTRAIARRRRDQERRQFGERVNATADQTLDVLGFIDPTGGFASETVRSLKDLPQQGAGVGGTLALAPLDAAQRTLGGIGALPELGVAGSRAIARAIARAPQPRGSGTYRRTK